MKILLFVAVAVVVAVVALAMRRSETVPASAGQVTGAAGSPPAPLEVTSLLTAYSLSERETGFLGTWQEADAGGMRVGFQLGDRFLIAHVGDFDADQEQLTELYIGTLSPSEEFPDEDSDQRLDRFLDEEGKPLAQRYILFATGPTDYPQLRIPTVRDGLAAFSDSVIEVGLYEGGGMHVQFDPGKASAASVETDISRAVSMVRALEEARVAL